MKVLESSERHYDTGINLLTFGNERKVKGEIVSRFISKNDHVFEIGVGTGALAILCARKGAYVRGIDVSKKMLKIAERKIREANLTGRIKLEEMSIVEIDRHVPEGSFDKVVGTFVFSELSERARYVPQSLWKRILYYLIRLPLELVTYILTQTATKPLKNIEEKLSEAISE